MSQPRKPKRKRKVSKALLEKDDHDLMEGIFGKRVMRGIDREVERIVKPFEGDAESMK